MSMLLLAAVSWNQIRSIYSISIVLYIKNFTENSDLLPEDGERWSNSAPDLEKLAPVCQKKWHLTDGTTEPSDDALYNVKRCF